MKTINNPINDIIDSIKEITDKLIKENQELALENAELKRIGFDGQSIDLTDPNAGDNAASVLFWKKEAERLEKEYAKALQEIQKLKDQLRDYRADLNLLKKMTLGG